MKNALLVEMLSAFISRTQAGFGEEMRTTTSDIQKVLFSEQYLININK